MQREGIHVFARLAIEFGSFEDRFRGGLLVTNEDGESSLQNLVQSSHSSYRYDEDHNQYIDNIFVAEMIRLRRMDLFNEEDIEEYELVHNLCRDINYFAANRFKFLVEWVPSSLRQIDEDGSLPLHHAAACQFTEGFQTVFEYGIRYYPIMIGINLLFQKDATVDVDNDGGDDDDDDDDDTPLDTPFQIACYEFERERAIEVVEETLARYSGTTPLDTVEALVLSANDVNAHLDCTYFLLRREPDLLIRLLHGSTSNNNDVTNDNVDGDDDDDDDNNNAIYDNVNRREDDRLDVDGNTDNGIRNDEHHDDATSTMDTNENNRKRKRDDPE